MVAFSCYIWNWNIVQDLLSELPKLLPDTALWLGGPEVSYHAQDLIQTFPQLAGIMIGEGEETFLELLKYYWEHTTTLPEIKGIVCKEGFTGERALVDIDRLPFCIIPRFLPAKQQIHLTASDRAMPIFPSAVPNMTRLSLSKTASSTMSPSAAARFSAPTASHPSTRKSACATSAQSSQSCSTFLTTKCRR